MISPVDAVPQTAAVAETGGQTGCPAEFRDRTADMRQETIVFHQLFLNLAYLLFSDFPRDQAVADPDRGGRPHRLPHDAAGPHYAGGTETDVSGADVPAGKHQIVDVPGVKRTERDPVGVFQSAFLQMGSLLAGEVESARQMIVDLPAAIGNFILESPAAFQIVLRKHMISDEPDAFAFSRQESDPFQFPVVRTVIAVVFHVIPGAECDFEQFVADFLRVMDRILHSAQFYPVEIGVQILKHGMGFVPHGFVVRVAVCPGRGNEFHFMIPLPALQQQTHAHGMPVGFLHGEFLTGFFTAFPSDPVFRTRQRRQDPVSRTIGKQGLGGYMASTKKVVEYVKHTSRPYIFSASITPASVATARAALKILKEHPERPKALLDISSYMREGLKKLGVKVIDANTPIISIMVYDDEKAFVACKMLLERGVYVNSSVSPAVPVGQALLRTSYTATHTKEQMDYAMKQIKEVLDILEVK